MFSPTTHVDILIANRQKRKYHRSGWIQTQICPLFPCMLSSFVDEMSDVYLDIRSLGRDQSARPVQDAEYNYLPGA